MDSQALEMSKFQIKADVSELENLATRLCLISSGSDSDLGLSRLGSVNTSHPYAKRWASSMSEALKGFISSKLPERQRLATAIGISAFVPDRKSYPSFTQPLIDSFLKISDKLAKQIRNEAFVARVSNFQSFFSHSVKNLLSVRALLDLGPSSSTTTLSQLISPSDISLLASTLSHTHISQYRKNRIISRIINKSKYSVVSTFDNSQSCKNKAEQCECSGSKVDLLIPMPDPTQPCLAKQGFNKFTNSKLPSIYNFLANERDSLTLTGDGMGGVRHKQLVILLKPPYIRIKKQFDGFLVAGAGIFLPKGLPGPISFTCKNSTDGKVRTHLTKHKLAPGLLRTPSHCNIQSKDADIVFINPTITNNMNISKQVLSESNATGILNSELEFFQPLGGWLSKQQAKEIETGLKNALSAEDFLQGRVRVLESVTWIYWLTWYIAPVLGALILIILLIITTYILLSCNCCCLGGGRCRRAMPKQSAASDQLTADIARLKGAFSLFVNSEFENLSMDTIKQRMADRDGSKVKNTIAEG